MQPKIMHLAKIVISSPPFSVLGLYHISVAHVQILGIQGKKHKNKAGLSLKSRLISKSVLLAAAVPDAELADEPTVASAFFVLKMTLRRFMWTPLTLSP